jgi:hypothetical protein
MTEASRFSGSEFLFNAPLYTVYTVNPADLTHLRELPIDGYCPYCHKLSTYIPGERRRREGQTCKYIKQRGDWQWQVLPSA